MQKFLIRRVFAAVISLIAATVIVFSVSRLYGDPLSNFIPDEGYGMTQAELQKVKESLHLDRAVPVQYALWIGDLLRGDLGISLSDRRPLAEKFRQRIFPTLQLAIPAWILVTITGVALGVLSAVRRNSIIDYVVRGIAILGQSVPPFWVALLSILVFAVWLNWLPAGTMGRGFEIKYYILPILILSWLPMAGYLRLTRSAMLEVLDSEYVKLARAKGVSSRRVIWKHAFRNSLIPALTLSSVLLVGLIEGSVAVETVFAWPGIGRWGVEAVYSNNLTVLALVTLVFTAMFLVANLITDLLYVIIDPRIRLS
jgi:peptide/nickel transport system permease protein